MEVIKNEFISKIEVVRILQKAYAEGRIKAKDGLASVLDDINAADVQPMKHGRWKPAKNGDEEYLYLSTILGIPVEDLPKYANCSECNFSFATNGVDKTGKALIHKAVYKYCPNCGARMDDDETIKG